MSISTYTNWSGYHVLRFYLFFNWHRNKISNGFWNQHNVRIKELFPLYFSIPESKNSNWQLISEKFFQKGTYLWEKNALNEIYFHKFGNSATKIFNMGKPKYTYQHFLTAAWFKASAKSNHKIYWQIIIKIESNMCQKEPIAYFRVLSKMFPSPLPRKWLLYTIMYIKSFKRYK